MKKSFFIVVIIVFILLGCSSDSSGPKLEEKQVAFISVTQGWDSNEQQHLFLGFQGLMPFMNHEIKGVSYTIYDSVFTTFSRNYQGLTGLTLSTWHWTIDEHNTIRSDFLSNTSVSIKVVTNIGTLEGEVTKINTLIQNTQLNNTDIQSVTLNKNEDVLISWEYSNTTPDNILILVDYETWLDNGSTNYTNKDVEIILLDGSSTTHTVSGNKLIYDGALNFNIIPINGVFSGVGNPESVERSPNMSGDGIGYFFIRGESSYNQNIYIGNFPQKTPNNKKNITSGSSKTYNKKIFNSIVNQLNK